MAIPFALPSDDEAEAQGQQLEQLMLDLYAALQQVLRSRTAQHPSRNPFQEDELEDVGPFRWNCMQMMIVYVVWWKLVVKSREIN